MTNQEKALELHEKLQGKLETVSKTPVRTREDLALVYTPGVAEPCKVIAKDPAAAYTYTMKANTVAVVSDGSAVLGREASCIGGRLQGVHGDKVLIKFLLQSGIRFLFWHLEAVFCGLQEFAWPKIVKLRNIQGWCLRLEQRSDHRIR